MTVRQNTKTSALLIIAALALSNMAIAFEQSFDLNSDGRLNDLDIIIVKKAIESGQCSSTKSCDLDGSGQFDMGDYNKIWDTLYGGFSQAPTASGSINLGTTTNTPTTPAATSPASTIKIVSGEQFKLDKGMTAVMEATDGFKLYLSGTEQMNCLRAGQCPPSAAHIELRTGNGIPRLWTIQEKGEQYFGNYKLLVYSVDASSQTASIIVTRQGATSIGHELEPVQIRPGSPFKLSPLQYGYIEGNLKLRLEELKQMRCTTYASTPTMAVPPSSCGPADAKIMLTLDGIKGEFNQYLTAGSEVELTDRYKLRFTEAPAIDVAVFVLEEKAQTPETTQSVQVTIGETFKLKTGWKAFKLGTDGFEFTVSAIDLPNCAQSGAGSETPTGAVLIQPARINPAVDASNAITPPAPAVAPSIQAPIPTQGMALVQPLQCKAGAVAVKTGGTTKRIEPGQTIGLTDRYTLSAIEIRGLADGQRVAVMIVKDKTSDIIEIPLGREFELATGQKSESNTEPYFSLTMIGINQVQCIRAPCPAHAELRLETKDRGDFEMSLGEGLKEPRAGLMISVIKTDATKKKAVLSVNREGAAGPQMPMPGSDRDPHGCIGSAGYSWCEAKQKCLRTWEEKCEGAIPPTQPASPEQCSGCLMEDKCIATGVRMKDPKKDVPVYCDVDWTFSVQKINGEGCQNSYECSSNTCADAKCTSIDERLGGIEKQVAEQRGLLDKLVGFFKKLFGFGE